VLVKASFPFFMTILTADASQASASSTRSSSARYRCLPISFALSTAWMYGARYECKGSQIRLRLC
jgi:hypothetical protein